MTKQWNISALTSDKKKLGIVAGIVVLMLVLLIAFCFQPDVVVKELTVEAGTGAPDPKAFLLEDTGENIRFEDISAVDFTAPGDYPVELRYRDRVYKSTLLVRDTVAPEGSARNLAAYAGETLTAGDFLVSVSDATQVTVAFAKAPDMEKTGSRLVKLLLTDLGGNVTEVAAVLTVFEDTAAPVLEGVAPLYTYLDTRPDYTAAVKAVDDWDLWPEITVDDSKVNLSQQGTYDLYYKVVDAAGNETSAATTVTVTDDNTAPRIYGVHEIAVYAGSTVDYTAGVVVRDDKDAAPTLTVDASQVTADVPGTYPLTYVATDITGNRTELSATLTVEEKPETYADETEVYAAIDAALAKITTADMTPEAKVRAVYSWIRSNYTYSGSSLRTDEVQAAWELMELGRGDCFHFFSLSKLMLERLGVEYIDVRKVKNHEGDTDHYWSMVTLDGETWYHFDTTPYPWDPQDFCLVTDGELDAFSEGHKGYFNRDTEAYPTTP